MIRRRTPRDSQSGQAAVETLFALPVMLTLAFIGYGLFAVTFTAQAAHVRARYDLMASANHMPCKANDDGAKALSKMNATASLSVTANGRSHTLKQKAVIKCE